MKRICEKRRTMEGATENGMMLCGPRVATHTHTHTHSLFLYSSQSSSLEDDVVRTEIRHFAKRNTVLSSPPTDSLRLGRRKVDGGRDM